MPFINTAKELFYGDRYFKEHVMAEDFDYRAHKHELSPFFAEHEFKVSMMYNDYYSRLNGIVSDRYLSMDLYYMYVLPCLNRRDMQVAYTDKNLYSVLFPDVLQPETVIKNVNGSFYSSDGAEILSKEAIEICNGIGCDCIIKPTVGSCNGDGVALLRNNGDVELCFREYGSNFIVQKKVEQHEAMSLLNESSLNTLRIFTYRAHSREAGGGVRYLNGKTFLRIGGRGSVKDNGSAGGYLAKVLDDGRVEDKLLKFKRMDFGSLYSDVGCKGFRIPSFEKAVEICVKAHGRLAYFDLVGWDVAIGKDGGPIFIEFNTLPSVEGPQMISGPFLSEVLEDIMERIRQVKKSAAQFSVNRFRSGFDYILQIGGEEIYLN